MDGSAIGDLFGPDPSLSLLRDFDDSNKSKCHHRYGFVGFEFTGGKGTRDQRKVWSCSRCNNTLKAKFCIPHPAGFSRPNIDPDLYRGDNTMTIVYIAYEIDSRESVSRGFASRMVLATPHWQEVDALLRSGKWVMVECWDGDREVRGVIANIPGGLDPVWRSSDPDVSMGRVGIEAVTMMVRRIASGEVSDRRQGDMFSRALSSVG